MEQAKKKSGFIKLIILIVIVLILLGYFGFNVENIINSSVVRGNLQYVWNIALNFWNTYLASTANYLWDKVVIDLFWNNLTALLNKVPAPVQ